MRRALGVIIIFSGLVISLAAQGGKKPLPEPTNLQVLPKTTTRAQLTPIMRRISGALGVDCTHCHVSMTDNAPDDKPAKAVARQMLRMTMAINNELLKGVGDPAAAGTERVTCYTCHRGALKPLTAAGGGTTGHLQLTTNNAGTR
jgi:hypothetical protein